MKPVGCLLLCLLCFTQEAGRSFTPGPAWTTMRFSEGRCQAAFPQTPRQEQQWVMTSQGRVQLIRFVAELDGPQAVCLVGWHDVPRNVLRGMTIPALLNRMRDGLLFAVQGKLITEQTCRLGPHLGLECRLEGATGQQVRARFFVVRDRLYQLLLVGTSTHVDDREVHRRFFTQFFLLS